MTKDAWDGVRGDKSSRLWKHAKGALAAGRLAVSRGDGARVAAEALRAQLDDMKGMAMKLGQIVSYLDVPLPEEAQEVLAALQQGSQGLQWSDVEALIEKRLGAPVDVLFTHIDHEPVAAASIGQVHRAQCDEGDVAVKVLYPGIENSFRSDIRGLHRVAGLAGLASAVDGRAIVDELGARLAEECDYLREARMLTLFRSAFAHDADVVIPRTIPKLCGEGVLTTSWVDGRTLAEVASAFGQGEKDQAAMTLMRFTYASLLTRAAIQADPHPGNQLFLGGARVCFLDFGCTRVFEPAFIADVRRLWTAVLDGRRADFDALVIELGFAPKPKRFDFDHHWKVERAALAPFRSPRFTFDKNFVRTIAAMNGPDSPNARHQALPARWVWIYRLTYGLHATLARLGASGPFAEMLREALHQPVTPLDVSG